MLGEEKETAGVCVSRAVEMTSTKNNASKSDGGARDGHVQEVEMKRRLDGRACCPLLSLWNLGYGFTAAGPAIAAVYRPCAGPRRESSHSASTTCAG